MATHALGYNQRLFGRGLRGAYHRSRFVWLTDAMKRLALQDVSVVELGCYDAKTITYLEEAGMRVAAYEGFDANWEQGLDKGRELWKGRPEIRLTHCERPHQMVVRSKSAGVGICMDVLEHINAPDTLDGYLAVLREAVRDYLFVTVPVERGPLFLAKRLIKTLRHMDDHEYTPAELLYATIGRMERVRRNQHKGFDERAFLRHLARHFTLQRVAGIFPGWPVRTWNTNMGIIAVPKG